MIKDQSGERQIKTPENKKPGLRYLFSLADKQNKRSLMLAIVLSCLSGLCSFVPYLMVFRVLLIVFTRATVPEGIVHCGLYAAAAIAARFVLQALSSAVTHIGAYDVLYAVRRRLCDHIGRISLGFYTENSIGEIKRVLMEDVERLEQFLAHQVPDIVVAVVVPLTVLIYLFRISIPMSLVMILPIVLTFVVQMIVMGIARPILGRIPGVIGRLNAGIIQFVSGMPVMKTYNLTADSYRDYADAVGEYHDLWVNSARVLAPVSSLVKVLVESGLFFTLPLGGWLYLKGSLELGGYLFFMIMSIVFLASYNNLLNFAQIFSQISAGIVRVKEVMDMPELVTAGISDQEETASAAAAAADAGPAGNSAGRGIAFDRVSFSYDGTRDVLKNISLSMPPGTLTAFVGASGAGKTTAAQLIPRFWDVTSGRITINGRDIRDYPIDRLMDQIAFVFQEAFILDDTIYENIAIGRAAADQAAVEAAARAAQIHDFIVELPNGYQTRLGESGVKLSGGEMQRVCIARAILKDAPIVIFDEATSFTDGENEHRIQLALNHLLAGKTTLMIAHRLHTIVHADQICVFKDGAIVEHGTHGELLARAGLYSDMWRDYTNPDGQKV